MDYKEQCRKIFNEHRDAKYVEVPSLKYYTYETPFNPNKFLYVDGKIRCNIETETITMNDMPMLNYYDRDLVRHSVTDISCMFMDCINLRSIYISNLDTSRVMDMHALFCNCTSIRALDIPNWNTSNVIHMNYMFYNCSSLIHLDISQWDTSRVQDMHCMFKDCSMLKVLDFNNWNTSNVTHMQHMFSNCTLLRKLLIRNWSIEQVMNMQGMFENCNSLPITDINQLIQRSSSSYIVNMDAVNVPKEIAFWLRKHNSIAKHKARIAYGRLSQSDKRYINGIFKNNPNIVAECESKTKYTHEVFDRILKLRDQ